MNKTVLLAEEGELVLLEKARTELGLDLSDAQIIYTGVGAINIIRSLQQLDRDTELINIGYAGSANFDIGTWVAVSEVRLNHPNVTYPEPELKLPITNHQSLRLLVSQVPILYWLPTIAIVSSIWNWPSLLPWVSAGSPVSNMSATTSRCMPITT